MISGRTYKDQIEYIPDSVLDAWESINYSQWKLKLAVDNKGESARLHAGVVAQDIKEAFEKFGLNATTYGILIYELWPSCDAVEYRSTEYNEDGYLISAKIQATTAQDVGEVWVIRMEECLALEAALMRRTQQRLDRRIAELEQKFDV